MTDRDAQLQQVRTWLETGEPRMRTISRACAAWDLGIGAAQDLVRDALREVSGVMATIERPEFLAQQITRLEALAARAMEEGNLSVALAAYRELHALARLG
jgi:hypothetical protein